MEPDDGQNDHDTPDQPNYLASRVPCWRKPAGGHPPALTLPDMLLITILRARYRMLRCPELLGLEIH